MIQRNAFLIFLVALGLGSTPLFGRFPRICLFGAAQLDPAISQMGITSKNWVVVQTETDPLSPNEGKLLILKSKTPEPDFESGLVRDFCHTSLGNKLGYSILPGGKIRVPNLFSANERARKLREAKDPEAPVFDFWEDTSESGAEAVEFCRNYVSRKVPYSKNGVKYHFSLVLHDVMAHAPGYFVIPEEVFQVSKARIDFQLALHDSPLLSKNELFQSYLSFSLLREMETIDPASYRIPQIFSKKGSLSTDNKVAILKAAFQDIGSVSSQELSKSIHEANGKAFHLNDAEMQELQSISSKFRSEELTSQRLTELATRTVNRFQK